MIRSKTEYYEYINRDMMANWRKTTRAKLFGDEQWKFILAMRKLEYYQSFRGVRKLLNCPLLLFYRHRYHRLGVLCGYTIPIGIADKGLALPHRGTIVINTQTRIGENCRIHQSVTIGSTSGTTDSARIGNNVFIGVGACIIGGVEIADDVAIGANAVVTRSITESGTTWAGAPARKISNNDSHSNLSPTLFN